MNEKFSSLKGDTSCCQLIPEYVKNFHVALAQAESSCSGPLTVFHMRNDTQMRTRRGAFLCLSNVTCAEFQDLDGRERKNISMFSPFRSRNGKEISRSCNNLLVFDGKFVEIAPSLVAAGKQWLLLS